MYDITQKKISHPIAKPFLKWAGGKTELLDSITSRHPQELEHVEITSLTQPGSASYLASYMSLASPGSALLLLLEKRRSFCGDATWRGVGLPGCWGGDGSHVTTLGVGRGVSGGRVRFYGDNWGAGGVDYFEADLAVNGREPGFSDGVKLGRC